MNECKPWEQLEGESTEAYARFLVYRNLGPTRKLEDACKVGKAKKGKGRQAAGQWTNDSTTYNWRERAARWDVAQLNQIVPETAGLIFEGIKEYARIVLRELQNGQYKPRNWAELRDSLVVLAGFVSPEVITAAVDNNNSLGNGTTSQADDPGATPPMGIPGSGA